MSNDAFTSLVEEQMTEMAKERAEAIRKQIVYDAFINGRANDLSRDDLISVIGYMQEKLTKLEAALLPKPDRRAVYSLFRQYMANDLDIGKNEIRAMIAEYLDVALPKLLGQMNIEGDVNNEVRKITYNTVLNEARTAWRERLSNTKMEIRVEGVQ